jgi:hypothetical protein
MHVQVQRAAKALNHRHGAALALAAPQTGLADLKSGDRALDDQQRRTPRLRIAGKQISQRRPHLQPLGPRAQPARFAAPLGLKDIRLTLPA